MQYSSLGNWYNNAFVATQINKMFSLTEYENMHPFEFEIYSILSNDHEKAELDRLKTQDSLARKMEERGF